MKTSPPRAEKDGDRRAQWKFGQNFLVDEGVIRMVCDDVPASAEDGILEIGPGQGALTRRLAPRCRKLVAVEIDPKWVKRLGDGNLGDHVEVVQADAVRADWTALLARAATPGGKPWIVGNLPYNRAAPILIGLLPHLRQSRGAQVMVQYEVGRRLCAAPHTRDFGFLSALVQNWAETELLRRIGPEAYRPRPKVWSATVRLTPRSEPVCGEAQFPAFLDVAFSQRRKKLANALQPFFPRAETSAALQTAGARADARAEDVSVPQFAELFRRLGPLRRAENPIQRASEAAAGAVI